MSSRGAATTVDDEAITDRRQVTSEDEAGKGQRQEPRQEPRLTDRDRDILGLLAVARYLSTAQLRRLCFDGKSLQAVNKRLLMLARAQAPYIRQQFFRTYDGRRFCAWAPTTNALPAARDRTSQVRELPRHDVGPRYLEHLLQLNELFTTLWVTPGRPARARHSALRWIPSDAVRLVFGTWAVEHGREVGRVIIPDAALELPQARRRYFLECEMGTNTIVPESPAKPGATLNKVARYQTYLSDGPGPGSTHYAQQYPDGFAPEVLFLVLNAGRAKSVNTALAAWRASLQGQRPVAVRALTFDDAAAELRAAAGLPALGRAKEDPLRAARADHLAVAAARVPPVQSSGFSAPPGTRLTPEEVKLVSRFVYDTHASIHGARTEFRRLGRKDLPPYPDTFDEVVALVKRLVAARE